MEREKVPPIRVECEACKRECKPKQLRAVCEKCREAATLRYAVRSKALENAANRAIAAIIAIAVLIGFALFSRI